MLPKFDVVGLGTSTVDILSLIDHFPVGEEVQQAAAVAMDGGGPAATALVTLARLGVRTAMLDAIGDDWQGDFIRAGFKKEGVCADYLQVTPGRTSSTASILVRQSDGARTIIFAAGTREGLLPEDVPVSLITSARFLHVNGRHQAACLHACHIAKANGVYVSFDGGAHHYQPAMRQLVPLTDICIVARNFAEQYTGTAEMEIAGHTLLVEGPRLVAITDGLNGSWVFNRDGEFFHQPAFAMPRVVDTTGCGDSYHGAFLYGLLQDWSLRETAALAAAVAALNTQALGGRAALPSLEQVVSFLQGGRIV